VHKNSWPCATHGCWWSLMTKSDRRLEHKKRTNQHTYAHMPLLLTKFHIYLEIIVLQDLNMNTVEKYIKRRIPTRRNADMRKGIIKRPIYLDNLGEVLPKEWPMPSQRPATRRRWPARPARVRPHPQHRLSAPPSSWQFNQCS
jgi:hypothetical protein